MWTNRLRQVRAVRVVNTVSPIHLCRCYSTGPTSARTLATAANDPRERLASELKIAMKARDSFASTVLRSVLSEVNAADKSTSGPVPSSQVISILRKAIARRREAAGQFNAGSRPELAESEKREADFLAKLLPPTIPTNDIDSILERIAKEKGVGPGCDPKRSTGLLLKAFYAEVDKSAVDGQLVKSRVDALLDVAKP